ncbi:MAG TPA: hypothetical protein VFU88_11000 [Ktedonobacterales bacterium]|nr:hypothetical protein [Ktedonobacterales bacterium]
MSKQAPRAARDEPPHDSSPPDTSPGDSSSSGQAARKSKLFVAPDLTQLVVATISALLVGAIYLALPKELAFIQPPWLLIIIEAALLAPVVVAAISVRVSLPYHIARALALSLLAVLTVALAGSVFLLAVNFSGLKGTALLQPAGLLWASNILVFALWYWETDGNGPPKRLENSYAAADFQFPQQQNGDPTNWAPGFVDYLFVAFCTSTALSPADTVPLTRRAKVLMMIQAVISLLILVLLVARSVNIIGQAGG